MTNEQFQKFQDRIEKILQEAKENKQAIRGASISIVYEKDDGQMHTGFVSGWPDAFRIIMVAILKNIASTKNIPEATVLSEVLNLSAEITKIKEKEHHERSI